VSGPDVISVKATVGMDEFYAKLAHYVRQAESGEEVIVTRWGREVARLGPPGSQSGAPRCR
jgi:prevent-host-death family protein